MYLQNVRLTNIRGFKDLNFDFGTEGTLSGWNVVTGDNGSGKSTFLKAIAVALVGNETARSLQPNFSGWISDGATESSILLNIQPSPGDTFEQKGKTSKSAFQAEVDFQHQGREIAISQGKESRNSKSLWSRTTKGWFSCGYGPFRRVFGTSADATKLMVSPGTERYVTMFSEAASLHEVDAWMRNLKYKELEGRQEEKEQLELLIKLLNDLLPNQISVDRVDSDGLWLKDRNGVKLSWSDMSDGYRSAVALLTDILRHLINCFGEVQLNPDGNILSNGIVLIDEIDAHLHPEWQREIGFWLTRHFPNLQFIVTTHSPLICQAARPDGIYVLPDAGSDEKPTRLAGDDYSKIIAGRPDQILRSPAFGLENTRSELMVDSRAELAKLNSKKRAGALLTADELKKRMLCQTLFEFGESIDD